MSIVRANWVVKSQRYVVERSPCRGYAYFRLSVVVTYHNTHNGKPVERDQEYNVMEAKRWQVLDYARNPMFVVWGTLGTLWVRLADKLPPPYYRIKEKV